jgi:hypothetical protein
MAGFPAARERRGFFSENSVFSVVICYLFFLCGFARDRVLLRFEIELAQQVVHGGPADTEQIGSL